jgi:GH24 family phage-related lysozyme (muramidase)
LLHTFLKMGCLKLNHNYTTDLKISWINNYVRSEKTTLKVRSKYLFGFNTQEKVDEIAGAGNHNTAKFWEYDTRLGRRWNLDPKSQVGISEYAAFMNNPISVKDVLGDKGNKAEQPKLKTELTIVTAEQVVASLNKFALSSKTGLSDKYYIILATGEGVALKMYDRDGDSKKGGNVTIGIGHKIHSGVFNSTTYDSKAIEKEKEFENGITVDRAFELLADDLSVRTKDVANMLAANGVKNIDDGSFSSIVDIYFNSGTENTKGAIKSFAKGGKEALLGYVSNKENNISSERQAIRLDLIRGANKPVDLNAIRATNNENSTNKAIDAPPCPPVRALTTVGS